MKKIYHRSAALVLALVLNVFSVLAADMVEPFPLLNVYQGYADVRENDWFYVNAQLCYEMGLMTGTGADFVPRGTLTIAELAAVTARMREGLAGAPIPAADLSLPWYQRYFDYLNSEISHLTSSLYGRVTQTFERPGELATRRDLVPFFALAVDGSFDFFPAINTVEALPDEGSDNVTLFFYNAGIFTGVDEYGTFAGERSLTRAECAAVVSRVAWPELRLHFSPADVKLLRAAGVSADTVFFQNGMTAGEYLPKVMARIDAMKARDAALGVEFNWFHTTEDGLTYLDSVEQGTLSDLGVTRADGTQAYADFNVQVFYSRYLDLSCGVEGVDYRM